MILFHIVTSNSIHSDQVGDWSKYLVRCPGAARAGVASKRGEAATNSVGPTAINSDMSCCFGGKVKHRRRRTSKDGRTRTRTQKSYERTDERGRVRGERLCERARVEYFGPGMNYGSQGLPSYLLLSLPPYQTARPPATYHLSLRRGDDGRSHTQERMVAMSREGGRATR